eukprot:5055869-Alexandrium_andersonii.AAC.1
MSASLVGSEMCIRDSLSRALVRKREIDRVLAQRDLNRSTGQGEKPFPPCLTAGRSPAAWVGTERRTLFRAQTSVEGLSRARQ